VYVLPVGISAGNLSVFWSLWDAALLRRYGRASGCPRDAWTGWWAAIARWNRLGATCPRTAESASRRPEELTLPTAWGWSGLSETTNATSASPSGPQPVGELSVRWPSGEPVPLDPVVIVVERWLRDPVADRGRFLDLFY